MEGISPAFMAEHPGTPGDKALPGKSGSSEKAENIPDSQVFINTTGISKIANYRRIAAMAQLSPAGRGRG